MLRAFPVALLGLTVLVMSGTWAFQRNLIYLPSAALPAPAAAGLPSAQTVTLHTDDGLTLEAWFVPPSGPRPAPAVLVCGGNGGNRSGRARLGAALAREGFGVLLLDYRGYGGNPGAPSERGLLSDARAGRAFLAARPDVDPRRLAYFGESLGAGVAAALAVEQPPAALILRSPFTSLADVGRLHYPHLPMALLRDRYPVEQQVAAYGGPLLVVTGDADEVIPADQSRRVAEAAAGPARFVLMPGLGHNDPVFLDGELFLAELRTFLTEAFS
jgi:fermentation-respiration switch protein FrsA (DUF1100 family)